MFLIMAICPEISGISCYDTKCWLFNLPKCGVTGFQGMCQSLLIANFLLISVKNRHYVSCCEKNVIRDTTVHAAIDCAMFAARKV